MKIELDGFQKHLVCKISYTKYPFGLGVTCLFKNNAHDYSIVHGAAYLDSVFIHRKMSIRKKSEYLEINFIPETDEESELLEYGTIAVNITSHFEYKFFIIFTKHYNRKGIIIHTWENINNTFQEIHPTNPFNEQIWGHFFDEKFNSS